MAGATERFSNSFYYIEAVPRFRLLSNRFVHLALRMPQFSNCTYHSEQECTVMYTERHVLYVHMYSVQ